MFRAKEVFLKKPSSVIHNIIWVSSLLPKFLKKTMINSKKGGGKDGQTPFCRIRQTIAAGPINIVNERIAE